MSTTPTPFSPDPKSPLEQLKLLDAAMRDAYWQRKDIDGSVRLASEGIVLGLKTALTDSVDRDAILSLVKTLAFNIASFTWVGWNEPGIVIAPAHRVAGATAAELNLKLAIELNRPPDKLCDAYWLLGATHLAGGNNSEALQQFTQAMKADGNALIQGYIALTLWLSNEPDAEQNWMAWMRSVESLSDPYKDEWLTQLLTAKKVFADERVVDNPR